jgi:protein-export membrane protein SecD/preprotein translocase SecF subunit
MSIRWRLIWIGGLIAACIFLLIPRDVEQRVYNPTTGRLEETTTRRIPIPLGLDLRGGVHLAFEVDESKGPVGDCAEAIGRAERVVRSRIDDFGTSDRVVQVVGRCRLIVELPGVQDPERAREIVQRTAFLEFRLTDTDGRLRRALPDIDAALRSSGVTPVLSELLMAGQTAAEFLVPEARVTAVSALLDRADVQRRVPRGIELRWASRPLSLGGESFRPLYALQDRAIITGEALRSAVAGTDPMSGAPEVQFQLTRSAGERFGEVTGRHIGEPLAILLDGRVEGHPPVIQSRITTSGRIELGGRSLQDAHDLALTLRAGALPVPLKVVEGQTIGPSLGEDSIRAGIQASLLAVALVLVVMLWYYRFAGLLAVGGLLLYTLFTLGGLAAIGSALTLPSLAGFALSIGMALDANVLIFERMREELGAGKPVRVAIDNGFRQAMGAIIDSNVTTALTAVILYFVGTGPVQGFAITLLIGLAASMVTAVFVTRTFFLIWIRRRRNVDPGKGLSRRVGTTSFDFLRLRRWAYRGSVAFIVPALLILAIHGASYSIEFTGGTLAQIRMAEPVAPDLLRSSLASGGIEGAEIQRFGSDQEYVIRARLPTDGGDATGSPAVATAIRAALDAGLPDTSYEIVRAEGVTPRVSSELQQKAVVAVLSSFVTTLAYLAVRFEGRFGVAAVLTTAHDILATLAFIRYLDLEISLVVVAALLTVLGYSLNDTIVIFDRVRENLGKRPGSGLRDVLNASIAETLPRTLLTGGTTLATALVLAFLAGEVLRPFALVMSFGIVVGTFSSIYIAAPTLLWLHQRQGARQR